MAETVGHADPYATRGPAASQPPAPSSVDEGHATDPGGAATDVRPVSTDALTTPFTPGVLSPVGEAPGDPLSTAAAQRYRILRAHQRGGLGQVSVARDEELNREVALKEILSKHADSSEARQRFLMEAEITGSLEHPGVVPVYGLGRYADGRPFYAMRFIRGETLQSAIDDYQSSGPSGRELRFRQLLGRFIDVCNAIEYAHNRCVVHRDIKPANVMLGNYGETLVVDWGLAKAVDADVRPADSVESPVRPLSAESSAETQLGRVVGTPAYMSPEQASGRVDMVGPAADVYSLGATLYHLVVGRPPFTSADADDVLSNVLLGHFAPPRSVNHSVPRPLEAICMKALALRPADRYASARALADDVERYLADEPVHAHRESVLARAGRWMRKHRAAVVGAGGVLAAIAASLAIGVVLLNAANERAERNFEMARNAIRDYYVTISEDELLERPQLQPLRERLLRQALAYYKSFLASEHRSDELLDELAQANFVVGQITASLESPEQALGFYRDAVDLGARMVALDPANPARLEAQARALTALGETLRRTGRAAESIRVLQEAGAVQKRLESASPPPASPSRRGAITPAAPGPAPSKSVP